MPRTVDSRGVLQQFFTELQTQGITYCVLRNYDGLPDMDAVGTDVDIWVAPAAGRRFLLILFQSAELTGWRLVGFLPKLALSIDGAYIFAEGSGSEIMHFDIYTSLHWKGIPYLRESTIRKGIIRHEHGFQIPSPAIEATEIILKKVLYENRVPERYSKHLASILRCHQDACTFVVLEGIFGKGTISHLRELAAARQWSELGRRGRSLRRLLFTQQMAMHPVSTAISFLRHLSARVRERLRPQWGAFVVLIGPDGSGKTTAAQNLLQSVATKRLFGRRIYLYRRFPLFPELKLFVRWLRRSRDAGMPAPTENLEEVKPFGCLRCTMYVVYYGVEYMLGRLWLWWQFGKNRALVVSDRYFHEYLLQHQFRKSPRWLLALLMKLIAQPDALIYLRTDPETACLRKAERSVQELQRQSALFEQWASSTPNGYIVESTSEEQTLLDIQRIVVEVLTRKQREVVAHLLSTYHGGQNERRC